MSYACKEGSGCQSGGGAGRRFSNEARSRLGRDKEAGSRACRGDWLSGLPSDGDWLGLGASNGQQRPQLSSRELEMPCWLSLPRIKLSQGRLSEDSRTSSSILPRPHLAPSLQEGATKTCAADERYGPGTGVREGTLQELTFFLPFPRMQYTRPRSGHPAWDQQARTKTRPPPSPPPFLPSPVAGLARLPSPTAPLDQLRPPRFPFPPFFPTSDRPTPPRRRQGSTGRCPTEEEEEEDLQQTRAWEAEDGDTGLPCRCLESSLLSR